MKKVVVFGAAGHTGKYITRKTDAVQQAYEMGKNV